MERNDEAGVEGGGTGENRTSNMYYYHRYNLANCKVLCEDKQKIEYPEREGKDMGKWTNCH